MDERSDAADPMVEASTMALRRMTEYAALYEHAMTRLERSEYHSEDLLDDWFSLCGKMVRDTTAAMAWAWRGWVDQADGAGNDGDDGT